ncbi:hypothetical protein BDZ89DRAFT_1068570 [Hymenopellis radicata]|nr:hypothetical protein BDZ89DRAFT_1068570 [Hymenopellis radicata]
MAMTTGLLASLVRRSVPTLQRPLSFPKAGPSRSSPPRRHLHATPPRLDTQRFEDEKIPFARATLVVPDPWTPPPRVPGTPAPKPPNIFNVTVRQAQTTGHEIHVKQYLAQLDRDKYKLALVRVSPEPVVILVDKDIYPDETKPGAFRPENDRIVYETAWLRIPGQPLEEINVKEYLETIDTKKVKLELITTRPKPIVALIDRAVERQARQEERENKKGEAKGKKEFQMGWNIAAGDLGHKLRGVRKELERGAKVDLADMLARIDEVMSELGDVARRYRETDMIAHRGIAVVFLEKKANVE